MTQYNTVGGFVQFDVVARKAGQQAVRDVIIQAIGSGGKNVKITLWPEHSKVSVSKGDFVVAQGKWTEETVNGTVYRGVSASRLMVFPGSDVQSQSTTSKGVDNALPEDDDDNLLF